VVVVGVTGSGKTTVAGQLAGWLHVPHVELDALHWQPGWVMTELDEFRNQVSQALAGPGWVVDGNYGKVRDLVWPHADTLVWLDYSLPVIFWQLARRTWARVIQREVLWNGNTETFRGAFLSRDSLFLWALHTQPRHRKEYIRLLTLPEYAHLQVVRLHNRKQTAAWLEQARAFLLLDNSVSNG
jgi:adenylate kinase family enzyme